MLVRLAQIYFHRSWSSEFLGLIVNSFLLASCAAFLVVALSLFLAYGKRLSENPLLVFSSKLCKLGYAVPGVVLAIGIMVPLAAVDNLIDLWARTQFGFSTGLLLSGSVFAIFLLMWCAF